MRRQTAFAVIVATAVILTFVVMRFSSAVTGSERPSIGPAPIPADEQASTIDAIKPPKRQRPLIAVVGDREGAETTDYLVPFAVLRQSDVGDVVALSTGPGPLRLMPALTVHPDATTAEFDARHPDGADYVIVPAVHRSDSPELRRWIREQRGKGATIVGICSGVKVLSKAGLLEGRGATGHWFDAKAIRKENPSMRWVPDRRYVADRGVVTTTGISASVPVSLAIVEAVAGAARAASLARELGTATWSAEHESAAFQLDRHHVWTAARNKLAIWNRETVAIHVDEGVDEIALAFTADAYSRTYRSRALAVSPGGQLVRTRRGLRLVTSPLPAAKSNRVSLGVADAHPALAVDRALDGIAARYGRRTAAFVALQLEYPWPRRE